jgi:YegS/Rv2252/BmrU family lipid kinase
MKNAMLIWNPGAGRVNVEREVGEARRVLAAGGWEITLEPSRSAAHVTDLARQAAQTGLEAVFVAGGDGTLGRAVAGLAGTTTALGGLPTGTTNVWAKEIGLPHEGLKAAVESARQLAAGPRLNVDLGVCNGNPFFLWAGFGLDARVVDQLEHKRSRFMKLINEIFYTLTILRCAAGWPGTHMQITADGQTVEGHFMLAVAGNIRYYAGRLLSPHAVWDDGKLELWLLRSGRRGGAGMALRHLWNLGWGLHVKDREALCLPFRRAQITFETAEWMHTDGEPGERVKTAEITVWERGLWVIVPGGVVSDKW